MYCMYEYMNTVGKFFPASPGWNAHIGIRRHHACIRHHHTDKRLSPRLKKRHHRAVVMPRRLTLRTSLGLKTFKGLISA